ncbi:MAG: guanylate kinase [Candidatus Scatovivens sp.]
MLGKDTIKKEIIKRMNGVETIPSYTTRPQREGDIVGKTYIFISKEEFEEKIRNNEFYEYDIHHNHYYGTSKKLLNEKARDLVVIKDIDVNGTQALKETLTDVKIITIFLRVPKDELKYRLENRVDRPSEGEIILRLNRFDYEESKIGLYDYVLKNDNLEKSLNIIQTIIEQESKS